MQRDAIDRLGLTRMLLEPELLSAVEPDVHLVGTLLSLNGVMPEETKETAREVVRKVVDGAGAAARRADARGGHGRAGPGVAHAPAAAAATSTGRARSSRNLKHYPPEQRTIVPGAAGRLRPRGSRRCSAT